MSGRARSKEATVSWHSAWLSKLHCQGALGTQFPLGAPQAVPEKKIGLVPATVRWYIADCPIRQSRGRDANTISALPRHRRIVAWPCFWILLGEKLGPCAARGRAGQSRCGAPVEESRSREQNEISGTPGAGLPPSGSLCTLRSTGK